MGTEIFAGNPPESVKRWIWNKYYALGELDQIVQLLESGLYDDQNPISIDGKTLSVGGSEMTLKFHVDADGLDDGYMEPCIVMGYNASIPQYVKYKSGKTKLYARSYQPGDKDVTPIETGDAVYSRVYDQSTMETTYTDTGDTLTVVGDQTFTYGNNNTYSVPMQIQVGGTTYDFAGYNITFQTRHIVKTGSTSQCRYVSPNVTMHNRWSQSLIRDYLNTFGSGRIYNIINMSGALASPTSIPWRFRDHDLLLKNVVGVVNRQWMWDGGSGGRIRDENGFTYSGLQATTSYESTVDWFWLPGSGNVNCEGLDCEDNATLDYSNHDETYCFGYCMADLKYDTTIFTQVYPSRYGMWGWDDILGSKAQWSKTIMSPNQNGTISDGSSEAYWLRSAVCDGQSLGTCVGYYHVDGNMDYMDTHSQWGVVPMFTIG